MKHAGNGALDVVESMLREPGMAPFPAERRKLMRLVGEMLREQRT
jgi:hypothetical protein